MFSRLSIVEKARVWRGRGISIRGQLGSSESDVEMSYRGGGYGRRGRGPKRGGGRGRGRGGSGRGRAGGGEEGSEGQGAPPPGLRGRALGMWYASRSRAQKKSRELKEVRGVWSYK